MSSSGERTHPKLITVGDFDPQADQGIEYDFIGRVMRDRRALHRARPHRRGWHG